MTRTPFDTFSKQFLEAFLSPLGAVETTREVPGESRFIDVQFVPAAHPQTDSRRIGLLGRIAATSCLIEPFRNSPTPTEVRSCLLKLFLVQGEAQRQARREDLRLREADLPQLWVLAPSASESLLQGLATHQSEAWLPGIYFLGDHLKTALVAINQLPTTEETLWIRILGKGATQQQAIAQVLALPLDDPRRLSALQLLAAWKITMEVSSVLDDEERELMVTLSQAYLDWEQETKQQGAEQASRSLILRLLTRRVGELPNAVTEQLEPLALAQLETLGEALLEFSSLSDLETWLQDHRG